MSSGDGGRNPLKEIAFAVQARPAYAAIGCRFELGQSNLKSNGGNNGVDGEHPQRRPVADTLLSDRLSLFNYFSVLDARLTSSGNGPSASGMVPCLLVLTLNPTTVACLVLGNFDDAFSNREIDLATAAGFDRHFVGQFANSIIVSLTSRRSPDIHCAPASGERSPPIRGGLR